MSEIERNIHPEEYRYRLTKFNRAIRDIIEQKILIDHLWPKPFTFEYEGETIVASFGERPKAIKELSDYLDGSIDRAFHTIMIEGK
jgi:hypothetical protein